jgi:hypothetical protein
VYRDPNVPATAIFTSGVTSKVTVVPAVLPTTAAATFEPRSPPPVVQALPVRRLFQDTSFSVNEVVT